jgi:hypothetical protein|eukprot:COSAG01_NODE_5809_length_4020_cov_3.629431_3_plen_39_part_00
MRVTSLCYPWATGPPNKPLNLPEIANGFDQVRQPARER